MCNPLVAAVLAASATDTSKDEETWLWPCNVLAWECWYGVQTQWQFAAAGGATGLNYAGVRAYLDEHGHIASTERTEIFRGICAAERASLEVWAEQRDKSSN
jgi:hypothetical protein